VSAAVARRAGGVPAVRKAAMKHTPAKRGAPAKRTMQVGESPVATGGVRGCRGCM
jgi:hypothetical protein